MQKEIQKVLLKKNETVTNFHTTNNNQIDNSVERKHPECRFRQHPATHFSITSTYLLSVLPG
jgi:hypothetical protein